MARAERRRPDAVKRAEQRSTKVMWGGMLLGGAIAVGLFLEPRLREPREETVMPVQLDRSASEAPSPIDVELLRVRVLQRYPHDPAAFTQGLLWADGHLYESTGQYGRSSLRKVRLSDGRILDERKLDSNLFGEGLARVDDSLVQLTWRSGRAVVSSLRTLEEREILRYGGEGWGLCYDGALLVMTDGSATLSFRNPKTMQTVRRVTVRKNGLPVRALNELECVDGNVYANIWRSDEIVRIDPKSGRVTAVIDARGLLSREERSGTDVLNGIAYRPSTGTFFLTGKYWPALFEVELSER